jgi:hypothetical protein
MISQPYLHFHPESRTEVHGCELEPGDILQKGDVYSSSNGRWEPCPCPGLVLLPSMPKQQDDESCLPPQPAFPVIWIRPEGLE